MEDPLELEQSKQNSILHSSITIPEAIKRINLHLKSQKILRDRTIQRELVAADAKDQQQSIELKSLANMSEIEEFA